MKAPAGNDLNDRALIVMVCDDIRRELGNKMSFMGCYQGTLLVASVPVVLPRLCIYANALTPMGRPFKSLTWRVLMDEKTELAHVATTAESLRQGRKPSRKRIQGADKSGGVQRQSISTVFMFSPFLISRASVLQVVAETETGELLGPSLQIQVAPDAVG